MPSGSAGSPAAEVPAAILAKTLGIYVQVVNQWQKISGWALDRLRGPAWGSLDR